MRSVWREKAIFGGGRTARRPSLIPIGHQFACAMAPPQPYRRRSLGYEKRSRRLSAVEKGVELPVDAQRYSDVSDDADTEASPVRGRRPNTQRSTQRSAVGLLAQRVMLLALVVCCIYSWSPVVAVLWRRLEHNLSARSLPNHRRVVEERAAMPLPASVKACTSSGSTLFTRELFISRHAVHAPFATGLLRTFSQFQIEATKASS